MKTLTILQTAESFSPFQKAQIFVQSLIIFSIVLILIQIFMNNKWQKIANSIKTTWDSNISELKRNWKENGKRLGVDTSHDFKPMDPKDLILVDQDEELRNSVVAILNHLEEVAGAIKFGALNKKYAYHLWSTDVLFFYQRFEPFVENLRKTRNDREYWTLVEWLYKKYSKKFDC